MRKQPTEYVSSARRQVSSPIRNPALFAQMRNGCNVDCRFAQFARSAGGFEYHAFVNSTGEGASGPKSEGEWMMRTVAICLTLLVPSIGWTDEYDITDVVNGVSGGLRTTVFHKSSSNGGMSGTILAQLNDLPEAGALEGTIQNEAPWEFEGIFEVLDWGSKDVIGQAKALGTSTINLEQLSDGFGNLLAAEIDWEFTLADTSAMAKHLDSFIDPVTTETLVSGVDREGVFGDDGLQTFTLTQSFYDSDYAGAANSFDGSDVTLWGASQDISTTPGETSRVLFKTGTGNEGLGADLRFQVELNNGGGGSSIVPVPSSAVLSLAALLGLAFYGCARKLREAARCKHA